jgi:hypothetical protein
MPEFLFSISFSSEEWLPSYLTRLAKRNHYGTLTAVENLCRQQMRAAGITDSLERPTLVETYNVISAITGMPPETIYAATVHRFALTLQPPGKAASFLMLPSNQRVPLLRLDEMRRHLHSKKAAQFCPACLREYQYHRLIWVPLAVTACLKHHCLLVDVCPCCQSPVSTQSIATAQCGRCTADLTNGPSIDLSADPTGLAAQRVIQSLLLGIEIPEISGKYHLPDQPPAALYYLLYGLQSTLEEARGLWPAITNPGALSADLPWRQLLAEERSNTVDLHSRYTLAFRSITNWPDGFCTLLSAYRDVGSTAKSKDLFRKMGNLYAYWIEQKWRHPAFQFIRDALNMYLADIYSEALWVVRTRQFKEDGELADRLGAFSIMDAAWRLGVSVDRVRELIEDGHLTAYRGSPYESAAAALVLRSEVYALQARGLEE